LHFFLPINTIQRLAVFPRIIKILPQYIFRRKDPIVVGCNIIKGRLKVGTPLCILLEEEFTSVRLHPFNAMEIAY
jgi:translation initiation factor IF-2